jgi:hypothetical protein
MPVNLLSAGGGTTTLTTASSASNFTQTLPAATGTTVLQNASNNLLMNSGYGSDAVAYGCRAWVNFNGTGTVAIRASGNVSSITDNGTGLYTVNFTTAMPDANYSSNVTGSSISTDGVMTADWGNRSSSSLQLSTTNASGTRQDQTFISVAIFR